MAAGPKQRLRGAQFGGISGPVREVWDVVAGPAITPSDATIYDPPLRTVVVGGAGTLVLVLDANDDAVANHRFTITCVANERVTGFAIRQIRAASTGTALLGFR